MISSSKFLALVLLGMILQADSLWCQTIDDARAATRGRDYASAAAIYEQLARGGDSEAAYQLASMYRAGRGVERDSTMTLQWMLIAAEAGDARAQYSMGQLLQGEDAGAVGQKEAYDWYQRAASQGHAMAIRTLDGWQQNSTARVEEMSDSQRQQALIQAARLGELERVRLVLSSLPDDARFEHTKETAMIAAITAGETEIVAVFLQDGVDPDGSDQSAASVEQVIPLHAAVRSENPAVLSLLLDAGANTERRDKAGNTALIIAAAAGSQAMALQLLEAGARLNPTDNRGWTALTVARQKGHPALAQLLLEHGGHDPVRVQKEGQSTEIDIATLAEGKAGWTPLMYAAWRGNIEPVRQILSGTMDVDAEVDARDQDGHTALSRAAWRGHGQIVGMLLAAGADPNVVQTNGYTALLWATQGSHREVIQLLVEANASQDVFIPVSGYSPLLLACSREDRETVELLLQLGAVIDGTSPQGETALMISVAGESSELVQLLLDRHADTEITDHRGRTAAWYAVIARRQQNLALLLAAGANADARDSSNQHLLVESVRIGDGDNVGMLLQQGVPADVQSESGNTGLIVAASIGRIDIMKILLERGADPDIRNGQGQSALMRTALANQIEAATILLQAGANTELVDKDHKTARDLAKDNGHQVILELLGE